MRRIGKTFMLLGVTAFACSANPTPATQTAPPPGVNHADILLHNIAWIQDSVPVVRFPIPFIYGAFRLQVEECSGKTREGWPNFYVAPITPLSPTGRLAFYAESSHSIVFGLGNEIVPWVVMHELLHYLLAPTIPPGTEGETEEEAYQRTHPAEYFDVKCGAAVKPPAPR